MKCEVTSGLNKQIKKYQMKNKRSVIVGIFIFIGVVILVVGVFTLGGQKKTFVRSKPLKAIFDDVQGLKVGDNVWFSGVKVGTVKKITFTPNAKVEVTINVEKEAWPLVRKDSKVEISSEGFIGNKIVVISDGTRSAPEAEGNDYLQVKTTTSTSDMLEVLQQNNQNLLAITNGLKDVIGKISQGEGTVGKLLNDESIANSIQSTIDNFRRTSIESERLIASVHNYTAHLNDSGTLAHDLISDTIIFNTLRGTITQLREVAFTASEFTNNLNKISDSLRKVSNNLTTTNSPVGVLLNDEQTANDLKATISNLRSGSRKLDEDLEALQHNFLLRGFFKKRAKEQEESTSTQDTLR